MQEISLFLLSLSLLSIRDVSENQNILVKTQLISSIQGFVVCLFVLSLNLGLSMFSLHSVLQQHYKRDLLPLI